MEIPKFAVDLQKSKVKIGRTTGFVGLTFEMMTFSARLFAISLATSMGVVCHDVPFRTLPSGNVISISWRGWSAGHCSDCCALYDPR